MDKKLIAGIIAVFFLGLVLALLLVMASEFGDAIKNSQISYNTNTSAVTSGEATALHDEITLLSSCTDWNNGTIFEVGSTCNLTNAELGTIKINSTDYEGAFLLLNYTYLTDTDGSTLNDSLITDLGNLSDWFGILILISIVMAVFGGLLIVYALWNTGKR